MIHIIKEQKFYKNNLQILLKVYINCKMKYSASIFFYKTSSIVKITNCFKEDKNLSLRSSTTRRKMALSTTCNLSRFQNLHANVKVLPTFY